MSGLTPEQAKQLDETLVNCQRAVCVLHQILDALAEGDGQGTDIAIALARHDADANAHGGFVKIAWTLESAVAAGGILTLPDGYAYVPGISRLDLSYEGADCCPGGQYEELSAGTDGLAHGVKLLFDAEAGATFQVRIHYVRRDEAAVEQENEGAAEVLAARVSTLETNLADLAAKAVYAAQSGE